MMPIRTVLFDKAYCWVRDDNGVLRLHRDEESDGDR